MTSDPTPFLVDRIAEDQAAANALLSFAVTLPPALFPRTREDPDVVFVAGRDIGAGQPDRFLRLGHVAPAQYMSRFHLLRAQREAAAKKNIVVVHGSSGGGACSLCVAIVDDRPVPLLYPCPTLVWLTWAYADHPDFDEAWASPEERCL